MNDAEFGKIGAQKFRNRRDQGTGQSDMNVVPLRDQSWKLAVGSAALALLSSCGAPETAESDTFMLRTFRDNQVRLSRLVEMAEQDRVQVLWFTTHELEPSDIVLDEDRWREYDEACKETGVRRLERGQAQVEIDAATDSAGFMRNGVVKGYIFSTRPLSPTAESLDGGIPDDLLRAGTHVLYKKLATNWYLFLRQQ